MRNAYKKHAKIENLGNKSVHSKRTQTVSKKTKFYHVFHNMPALQTSDQYAEKVQTWKTSQEETQARRRASCGVSHLEYIHILLHLRLPLSTVGEAQTIAKWSVKNPCLTEGHNVNETVIFRMDSRGETGTVTARH